MRELDVDDERDPAPQVEQAGFETDDNWRRIKGALVDMIPMVALFLAMAAIVGQVSTGDDDPTTKSAWSFNVSLGGWGFIHYLALIVVYYTVSETITGTSFGKWVVGLKVIGTGGRRPGPVSLLVRNVIRIIDFFPVFYISGILTIAWSPRSQRIGDMVARTQVGREVAEVSSSLALVATEEHAVDAEEHPPAPPTSVRYKREALGTRMALAICVVAAISAVSIILSPYYDADSAGRTRVTPSAIPTDHELRTLVSESMWMLGEAILTGNFESFHSGISEIWQAQITREELATGFTSVAPNSSELGQLSGLTPIFDKSPEIDSDGLLVITGNYPTNPLEIHFKLGYIQENSSMKLVGIRIFSQHQPSLEKGVPTTEELRTLVTNTLSDLDRALQAKNFTSFYGRTSEITKNQLTPETFNEAFESFISNNIRISGLSGLHPIFEEVPRLDERGFLILSG